MDFDRTQTRRIKLVEVGTIEPKRNQLVQDRIAKIYECLQELIVEHRPDVMVLEKLYVHENHPTIAFRLGHVRGVICLLCAQHDIKLAEHSVKRVRKAILGNGNASKQQTQHMVAQVLGIDESKLTMDASDALALALGYIHIEGKELYDHTNFRKVAVTGQ